MGCLGVWALCICVGGREIDLWGVSAGRLHGGISIA